MAQDKTHKIGNHEFEFVKIVNKKAAFAMDRAKAESEKKGDSEIVSDAVVKNIVAKINLITQTEVSVGDKKEKSFEKKEIPFSEWDNLFAEMDVNDYIKVVEICNEIVESKVGDKKK